MAGGETGHFVLEDTTQEADGYIVRLRGLPYSAKRLDVLEFLKDCNIVNQEDGITFTFDEEGRPTGEAFVDLASADDVEKAMKHDNEHMGRRYVEIFRATRGEKEECDFKVPRDTRGEAGGSVVGDGTGENVVRLRGLPFGASDEQVKSFFSGLSVIPGGVTIQRDVEGGRETGIGYVQFVSKEDAEKALERDKQSMGHRYIEVFRSSVSEIKPFKTNRGTPYNRPGRRDYGGYGGYGAGYRNERSHGGRRGGGRNYDNSYGSYNSSSYREEPFYEDSNYSGGGYSNRDSYDSYNQSSQGGDGMVSYPTRQQQQQGGGDDSEGYSIRMRGLPFSTERDSVLHFFEPQVPIKIHVELDEYRRPSGEGMVTFATRQDAEAAMKKNRNLIGHRYIELFKLYDEHPGQQSWSDPRNQDSHGSYGGPKSQYHSSSEGYGSEGGYQQQRGSSWSGVGY